MRTCYIAAPFIYDAEGTLRQDIRSLALGNPQLLMQPQTPLSEIVFCGERYQYIGPFWYEETDGGVFTDSDSAAVVRREKALIDRADLIIVVFDGTFAPGTGAELVYAATVGKEVAVVYKREACAESDFPSLCWYPIVLAQTVGARVRLFPMDSMREIVALFHKHTNCDYDALLTASCIRKGIGE